MLYGTVIGFYVVSVIICYLGTRKILSDLGNEADISDVLSLFIPVFNTFLAFLYIVLFLFENDKKFNDFFFLKK